MTLLILLGLLNGVAVSLSRTLNGRLASARGAMTASLANHLLGFGLLGVLLILKGAPWERLAGLDPWLLLGGVLGALFVAISSWAIGRIGALACALLIVTGQLAGRPARCPGRTAGRERSARHSAGAGGRRTATLAGRQAALPRMSGDGLGKPAGMARAPPCLDAKGGSPAGSGPR